MEDMTLKEASEKWGISVRRINLLCKEGRIPGAIKRQNLWIIPASAQKPTDGRRKKAPLKEPGVLLRNTTYIESHAAPDLCDYDIEICQATRLFLEGHLEESQQALKRFVQSCDDKQYLLVGYYILYYNSTHAADTSTKKDAKSQIDQLLKDPEVSQTTKALVRLRYASNAKPDPIFLTIAPELMQELTPLLSLQSLRLVLADSLKHQIYGSGFYHEISSHHLKEMNCPEIYVYYNIILAEYYFIIGANAYADIHLKEAAGVALSRKWYTPFAQYALGLDLSLIDAIDHDAYQSILSLADKTFSNYLKQNLFSKAFSRFNGNEIITLQVAYQIACNKTNAQIAHHLGLSEYAVKKQISIIYERTGYTTRAEIKDYILSHIFL